MDPRTGRLLAVASDPTFDPSLFVGGLAKSEAHQLDLCAPNEKKCPKPSHNAPLLDRATQALYPPGSTFKPFVAAAALADRYASPNTQIACPGSYVVPIDPTKHEFHNWDPVDIGTLDMSEALWYSCDTVFYQLGFRFWLHWKRTGGSATTDGDEQFQRELRAMGFGRPTGIDASPEFGGLVPTWAYVKKVYKANPRVYGKFYGWLPGESLNLSIGQGFVLVTPMQLAVGYSAIANGGTLYAPRLGWKIERPDGQLVRVIRPKAMGRLPISRKQALFLRTALTGVPKVGTAAAAFTGFPLSDIPVAGKTGTADVYQKQPYSWFAAIAPADHPKYVVVCLVEQGGHGSTTAAPVVRRILEGLFGLTPENKLQAGAVVD
jgi:penicillin-binding protein 2